MKANYWLKIGTCKMLWCLFLGFMGTLGTVTDSYIKISGNFTGFIDFLKIYNIVVPIVTTLFITLLKIYKPMEKYAAYAKGAF